MQRHFFYISVYHLKPCNMRRSEFKLDLKSSRAVSQACVQIIQLVASYAFLSVWRLSFYVDTRYVDFREYSKSYLQEIRRKALFVKCCNLNSCSELRIVLAQAIRLGVIRSKRRKCRAKSLTKRCYNKNVLSHKFVAIFRSSFSKTAGGAEGTPPGFHHSRHVSHLLAPIDIENIIGV